MTKTVTMPDTKQKNWNMNEEFVAWTWFLFVVLSRGRIAYLLGQKHVWWVMTQLGPYAQCTEIKSVDRFLRLFFCCCLFKYSIFFSFRSGPIAFYIRFFFSCRLCRRGRLRRRCLRCCFCCYYCVMHLFCFYLSSFINILIFYRYTFLSVSFISMCFISVKLNKIFSLCVIIRNSFCFSVIIRNRCCEQQSSSLFQRKSSLHCFFFSIRIGCRLSNWQGWIMFNWYCSNKWNCNQNCLFDWQKYDHI